MGTEFNVEEVLTTDEFTIPIELSVRNPDNISFAKRKIFVTYQFNDEISEAFKVGKTEEVEVPDDDNPGQTKKESKRVELSMNEQLVLVVKKVQGVETLPTEEFWTRTAIKYRKAILEAILNDVFPNA